MPVVYPWSLIMINNISQKNWIFALGLLTDIQHGNNRTKIRILLCLEQPSLTKYTCTLSVLRSHHCCFAILNLKLFKIKLQKD